MSIDPIMVPDIMEPNAANDKKLKKAHGYWIHPKTESARFMVVKEGDEVRLFTKNYKPKTGKRMEATRAFKELLPIFQLCPDDFIIECEMHSEAMPTIIKKFISPYDIEDPFLKVNIYELLEHNGELVRLETLPERYAKLEKLYNKYWKDVPIMNLVPTIGTYESKEQMEELLKKCEENNWIGYVLKNPNHPYNIGTKTENWLNYYNYKIMKVVFLDCLATNSRSKKTINQAGSLIAMPFRDFEVNGFKSVKKFFVACAVPDQEKFRLMKYKDDIFPIAGYVKYVKLWDGGTPKHPIFVSFSDELLPNYDDIEDTEDIF